MTQEHNADLGGTPMMSLAEFAKAMKHRPIKLAEADEVLKKFGLKLAFRYSQGRHQTGLLIKSEADRVIAARQATEPKRFQPAVMREEMLEKILTEVQELKAMVKALSERK